MQLNGSHSSFYLNYILLDIENFDPKYKTISTNLNFLGFSNSFSHLAENDL